MEVSKRNLCYIFILGMVFGMFMLSLAYAAEPEPFDCSKHYRIETNGKVWAVAQWAWVARTIDGAVNDWRSYDGDECSESGRWFVRHYAYGSSKYLVFDNLGDVRVSYDCLCDKKMKEAEKERKEEDEYYNKIAGPYHPVDPKSGKAVK